MKFIPFILLCASLNLTAQDFPQQEIDLGRLADEIFGFQDLDISYEELYENMAQLLSNPLNINSATEEELRFLNILTEGQIKNLLTYRKENGLLLSIYELQTIAEFDLTTLYKLAPFVRVIDPSTQLNTSILERITKERTNYLLARYERTLETKQGFIESDSSKKFQGSPGALYVRFRAARPGDFSIGFTVAKDAGEPITWKPAKHYYGLDFWSFHAQVQNKGKLKNLVIGDFQCQFAQGITMGGLFGTGKGAETITTTRRSNIGFLPYTSINEANNLHGIAATYGLTKNIFLSGYYSQTLRDASVTIDTAEATIASFQSTGLHRNEVELNHRKMITEKSYGTILNIKNKQLDAGLTFNAIHFSVPVKKQSTIYSQFNFRGKQNLNGGFYLNYNSQNFTFFSEAVKSFHGGWGLTAGLLGSLTTKLDISIVFRKFDRHFYSFYSNPFAESSVPQNETGIYWGWRYRFNKKYTLAGYTDLFQFPWLRYRSYTPSNGHEWLVRFNYQPSRQVLFFVQLREEVKVRNEQHTESNLYHTAPGTKRNYWINVNYGIGQQLRLQTRGQFSTYNFANNFSKGLALCQDIKVELGRFDFTGRYVLFDTDDYDNRQYVYEFDVWLAYSLPAYYGVGVRKVAMVTYKINRHLTCWLWYGYTRFTDRNAVGSGLEYSKGNTRNDLTFQVKWLL